MKAFETVPDESIAPATDAGQAPAAAELTGWLLAGRFFTVGSTGSVTSWSPIASETFGWRRKEIVGDAMSERLAPGVTPGGYTGRVDAGNAAGSNLPAEFAFVPIQLSVGYEFNSLLQDISARSTDADSLSEFAKAQHDSALSLVEKAWGSGGDEAAGWLVVFRAGAAAAVATSEPVADNVVSIADAAGAEEARAQLERARRDADEGRVEIRSLEGQLEEARREAQRARQEVDVARQEAGDSRDALVVAQRGAEDAQRQLADVRRQAEEGRTAAEEARIRAEEVQRESDSLREQLREARESARGMVGQANEELAAAKEREAALERSLADTRAEAARHEAEVEPLRERYQAAQRELGALRADLESARAEGEATRAGLEARLADSAGKLEQRSGEVSELRGDLERARTELEGACTELEARSDGSQAAPLPASVEPELRALRERLERMRAAFDRAPIGSALIAPDGRFVEVSDALCDRLGHARERLLSGEPPAIVHPDDVDAHRDLFHRILAGEQAEARGLRRYLHADGHAITMRESVALLRDGDGRPDAFVVQLDEAGDHGAPVVVDAEVEPATPADDPHAVTGDAMRRALEDELFELHCQPVLDLRTNAIVQHELLIRMRGEDGRLILPQAFLGPARRAGLAHSIDRWVVRRAIRLLAETEKVSLEVNLSPEAVHDPDLATMVDEELSATSVDPGRLVLEVSGSTAADHIEETRELAKSLRGLGCRFALDDFRSNFGSFRLIRDLPLDYLKLDGELVASLAESRTSQLIVKALVDVAAGTGMKTVAVFVSDEETVQMLRQLGVGFAQGYAVGRPRPVEDVLTDGGGSDPRQLPAG